MRRSLTELFKDYPTLKHKDFTEEELSRIITRADIRITKEEGYDEQKLSAFEEFALKPHTFKEYVESDHNFFIFIRENKNDLPIGLIFSRTKKIDFEAVEKFMKEFFPKKPKPAPESN